MSRIHLDLPAVVVLAILGSIFLGLKVSITIKVARAKELSASVRKMFVLRNVALLVFLATAAMGFLWPNLWDRHRVDLIAVIAWFGCWATLSVALQIALKRQRRRERAHATALGSR